jgi:hypothetical protein
LRSALLSWLAPDPLAPARALVERTTTTSPTFRPLTTWVVESPATPSSTRRVVLEPSLSWTVTVEPVSACEGTAMPETCAVMMSAVALMPSFRCWLVWASVRVTG